MTRFLTALVVFASTIGALAADEFPAISRGQLKKALESGRVTLLDAAGTGSYAQAHIPGALDFDSVKGDLAARLPADKGALIVAYCANERCPYYRKAASAARALGYTNVKHFVDGIQGWQAAGEKVEKRP